MLQFNNLYNNIFRSTQSNAFLRSIKQLYILWLFSTDLVARLWRMKVWSVQDVFLWKPPCSSTKKPSCSLTTLNLVATVSWFIFSQKATGLLVQISNSQTRSFVNHLKIVPSKYPIKAILLKFIHSLKCLLTYLFQNIFLYNVSGFVSAAHTFSHKFSSSPFQNGCLLTFLLFTVTPALYAGSLLSSSFSIFCDLLFMK